MPETKESAEREALRKRFEQWKAEGYQVDRLSKLLEAGLPEARMGFEKMNRVIDQLRDLSAELKGLETDENSDQISRVRALLKDPWSRKEAESAVVELKVAHEKRRKEGDRQRLEEARFLEEAREKLSAWKALGYEVEGLEKELSSAPDSAEEKLHQYEEHVARLRACEEELRGLDTRGFEKELDDIAILMDPAKVVELEEAILQLRLKVEKARRLNQARLERERKEKERLLGKFREWSEEGFAVESEEGLGGLALPEVLKLFKERSSAIHRLRELKQEIAPLDAPELSAEKAAVEKLLSDARSVQAAEDAALRLKVRVEHLDKDRARREGELRKRRSELQAKIQEWREKGYDVTRLEDALTKDDETQRKELAIYRLELRRLQELEAELRAFPAVEEERAEVERLLRNIRKVNMETIRDLEDGLHALKNRMQQRREQGLREKERERQKKQAIVERLLRLVEEGYRDGLEKRLERLMTREFPELERDFSALEIEVARLEDLRRELETMEGRTYEEERKRLLALSRDLSKTSEVESGLASLKEKLAGRRRDEERRKEEEIGRRQEAASRINEWRALGFDVTELENSLGADLATLRKRMALYRIRIQKVQELREELASLPSSEFPAETEALRQNLSDLEKIPENEERLQRLRSKIELRLQERRRVTDFRQKMEEWRSQGYDVTRLERALQQDLDFMTKEFVLFKIRSQKLREMEEELTGLDPSGFEEEVASIRRDLRNVDRVGELRDRLSDIVVRIGNRRTEVAREQERRKKLRQEYTTRMASWVEEGFYVDELERALGGTADDMAARLQQFEDGVEEARRLRLELDAFHQPGSEELVSRMREKLRDVPRIGEAWEEFRFFRDHAERKGAEESRRKKDEEELRQSLAQQVDIWKRLGYDVSRLGVRLGGDLEALRKAISAFRIQLERMRDLKETLSELQVPGLEEDVESISEMLRDPSRLEEAEERIEKLRAEVVARRDSEQRSREERLRGRRSCSDRLSRWISEGYSLEYLESLLDLPLEEMEQACARTGELIGRLESISAALVRNDVDISEPKLARKLRDIEAISELEAWLKQSGLAVPKAAEVRAPHPLADIAVPGKPGPAGAERTPEAPEAPGPSELAAPAAPEGAAGPPAAEAGPEASVPTASERPSAPAPTESEAHEAARRDPTLQRERLRALRVKLAEWKAAGYDVLDLESYLSSPSVTPDGIRTRLEELNRRMKEAKRSLSAEKTPAPPEPVEEGEENHDGEAGTEGGKKMKRVKKVVK